MIGILNGIDTVSYDPTNDPFTGYSYSAANIRGKRWCKRALQKRLELPLTDAPMLTMISRLVAPKGEDINADIKDHLLSNNDMQFVMLGTGDAKYEEYFRGLQNRYPEKVRSLIEFNTGTAHEIYAAGDMFLMPSRSEACGLAQMICCRYGNTPIVRLTGGLADSIREWDGENGNGFTFFEFNGGELEYAIRRALNLYDDRKHWNTLVKHIMDEDFTWERSAEEYGKLYSELR